MRAGALRKRVSIQRRSQEIDASGGFQSAWSEIGKVWAEIVPAGGKEEMIDGAIRDSATFTISMRYFSGLAPKDRIVYSGRVFNVVNVNNVEERNREMQISAVEGLNNG